MKRVLIVEDEGIIAKDLVRTLENLGYEVPAVAATEEEAVDAARRTRPHCILMDIRLRGGGDGTEAARRIAAEQEVAVVFLTAYADEETMQRAKESGPYGYIVKPFDEETLRTTLETVLARLERDRVRSRRLQLHEEILGRLPHGVVVARPDGHVDYANDAARRLIGEDPTGASLSTFQDVGDEHGRKGKAAWTAAIRRPEEASAWRFGGRPVTVSAHPLGERVLLFLSQEDQTVHAATAATLRARLRDRASELI